MRRVASIVRLDTFEQKKQLKPPSPKYPAPSTKKGRFSSKNVSNADRFTTAGSTSTWPKSGLTVALSVKLDVTRSVAPDPAVERVRIEEWIGPVAGHVRGAAHQIGHDLGTARRVPDHQAMQMAEARRPARLV